MQWISRSSTARSFEGKWSPKIRPPYEDPEDLEDDVTLVFRKPSWQLRASLASVLITPVLYQLYLIMVTIRYILFLQTFSSPPRSGCPVVDLSWTGVLPCELGWRGSALAVLILSAVLITCYSLITACLARWNPQKRWNSTTSVFDTQEKPTKFQVRVQSTNRPPTLSLYILLLIFRLLLQSGDVEANPGPITLASILTLDDMNSVYNNLIKASGNWFNLGLALGVHYDTLKNIESNHRDSTICLREMLADRLKTSLLTYSEICQSLRVRTVERIDVAEAIDKEFTDELPLIDEVTDHELISLEVNDRSLGIADSDVEYLTVDNIVRQVGVSKEILDQHCSSKVLEEISRFIPFWTKYADALNLSKAQIQLIVTDSNLSDEMKGQKVLELWNNANDTTYRILVDTCLKLRDRNTAIKICELVEGYEHTRVDLKSPSKGFKWCFEKVMKTGYVSVKTVNVIIMGPSGSGKTSLKDLLLNNKVKEERNSTPPCDRTIQVRSVASHLVIRKGEKWNAVRPQDLLSLAIQNQPETLSNSVVKNSTDTSTASSLTVESIHSKPAVNAVVDELEEISATNSTSVNGEEVFGTMTIRVTDSGGQPQFHDIAPLFTRGTSAGVYVMKLTDNFNNSPSDEVYIGGQQVGTPSLSHMSHRETILSLIQSLLSVNTHEKKPRCIFVGTFKDAFINKDPSVLSAALEEKNKELHTLVPECFRVHGDGQKTQQILALNAISRDEDTLTTARAIRNAVEESPYFESKVPLRWFALELSLKEFCTKVGRRVLTISECVDVAKHLHSDTDDLNFALKHFDKFCIVHYYPQKLPGVVFVDPQIPLEIINDLVRYAMSLRGGATQLFDSDPIKWKLFRDGGILTLDMLESAHFEKHFLVGIFVPEDMIKLMKVLLLITPLTNSLLGESANMSQFFMPALLKSIPRAELKNCCIHEPSVDPLLVCFTNGCIRAGVFCCLVVFLMKTCGWEKMEDQVPQARNCIKLRYRKDHCFVTLVDSIAHIEVYVKAHKIFCENLCPKIKENISEGIRVSQKALHYSIDAPEFCFFCPCIHDDAIKSHHAEINGKTWNCSEKPDEYDGKLENKHLIWFEKKNPEESEHLTVDIIVREVGIRKEVLDQRCSSELLQEIGQVLPNWLKYAKALKLSRAQINGIKTDNNLDYEMKGQTVLEFWHNQYTTSYRMLVDICLKLKDGETAREICKIVKDSYLSTTIGVKKKREDNEDDEDGECSTSRVKRPHN